MAAKRTLTKDMRERLERLIMDKAFKQRLWDFEESTKKTADRIYWSVVGESNHAQMMKLPKEYFQWDDSFSVEHPLFKHGRRVSMPEWQISDRLTMTEERALPYQLVDAFDFRDKEGSLAFTLLNELAANQKNLIKAISAYRDTVQSLLFSTRTVEDLVAAWPDGEDFVKAVLGAPVTVVDSVSPSLVNAVRMGLSK